MLGSRPRSKRVERCGGGSAHPRRLGYSLHAPDRAPARQVASIPHKRLAVLRPQRAAVWACAYSSPNKHLSDCRVLKASAPLARRPASQGSAARIACPLSAACPSAPRCHSTSGPGGGELLRPAEPQPLVNRLQQQTATPDGRPPHLAQAPWTARRGGQWPMPLQLPWRGTGAPQGTGGSAAEWLASRPWVGS